MSEIKRLVASYAPLVHMSEVFCTDRGELEFQPIIGITVWEITEEEIRSAKEVSHAEISYITAEDGGLAEHYDDSTNQLGIAIGDAQHELNYWVTEIRTYLAKLKGSQKA